ncbi:MAG: hypothetical protein WCJ30_16410, partial [Deltaproteobacteria bacterium]
MPSARAICGIGLDPSTAIPAAAPAGHPALARHASALYTNDALFSDHPRSWTRPPRVPALTVVVALAAGCAHHAAIVDVPAPRAMDAGAPGAPDAHEAAVSDVVVDSGPTFTPPSQIVALGTWVPIRRDPRRDSPLVGYMRAGGITAVTGMPVGRETCPVHRDHPEGGWYHTAAGGYVCVGGALAIPWPARSVRRPTQAVLDAGMPYDYAVVYGTPILYREPPSEDTLRVYEPW